MGPTAESFWPMMLLVVGPKTGLVYFTDASVIYPERDRNLKWDAMYSSKVEMLIGPSGRLLKYDPVTDEVSVLLRDLWFGNSVTVDQEETYLLFTESFSLRIGKYYLQGPKEGTVEYLVNGHPTPGCKLIESTVNTRHLHARLTFKTFSHDHDLDFDGVDCSWNGVKSDSSYCYSVIISYIVPAQKLVWKLPHPLDAMAKTILLMLPKSTNTKNETVWWYLGCRSRKDRIRFLCKAFSRSSRQGHCSPYWSDSAQQQIVSRISCE
jgi:hypothetical protein